MFHGSFQCVSRKLQGRFREVSLMFYESLKEGCFEGVLRCFKEVLSVCSCNFQGRDSFKGVFRVFQRFF